MGWWSGQRIVVLLLGITLAGAPGVFGECVWLCVSHTHAPGSTHGTTHPHQDQPTAPGAAHDHQAMADADVASAVERNSPTPSGGTRLDGVGHDCCPDALTAAVAAVSDGRADAQVVSAPPPASLSSPAVMRLRTATMLLSDGSTAAGPPTSRSVLRI